MDDRKPLPLKGWTTNQGVKATELARRTGFTPAHVVQILNRRVPPSRDFALAVTREFNLGLEEAEVLLGAPKQWVPGWPASRRAAPMPR